MFGVKLKFFQFFKKDCSTDQLAFQDLSQKGFLEELKKIQFFYTYEKIPLGYLYCPSRMSLVFVFYFLSFTIVYGPYL